MEPSVFTLEDPRAIVESLKWSADHSTRRKARSAYASAMSMLTFYIDRTGDHLDKQQRGILEQAKTELRALYARPAG
jgi:hypothetical protein